jgi:MarR family transcriptional regulator, negative regulator of the multidrug operon emrRAB
LGVADRLAQLLGALSLSATDRFRAAVESSLGRGGAHAGALVHLDAHPGGSVQGLADVLGISQPAAVKLAERLVADGLVERGPGPDRRTVALAPTPAGREAARRLLAERASELEGLLGVLDAEERDQLAPLLEKLVAGLAGDRPAALTACRLCDRDACWGERGTDCPLQHTVS